MSDPRGSRTRAFVAVDVATPALGEPARARVDAPASHLTLRFFDELPPGQVVAVIAALDRTAATSTEFTASLEGVGAFPDERHPRVLWVGVGEGREALERLAERLAVELAAAGFPRDPRPFTPHVTVLRVRRPADHATAREWLGRPGPIRFGSTRVRELVLKESRLERTGAEHRVVHRSPLSERSPSG